MIHIDEAKLDFTNRLGLAYCRLNCRIWDEILGPKPDGFDSLPDFSRKGFLRKKRLSKSDYVYPALHVIESIIGKANTSRCWWLFQLGRTEAEWIQWYASEALKTELQKL